MAIEETFDRLATNVALLTGAIATLSESVNGKYAGKPIYQESGAAPVAAQTTAAATPKPRGRPAKGEAAASATPAASTAAVEADPFAGPAATSQAPAATLDEVRAALTALKDATSQAEALAVLKVASKVDNLGELQKTPEKYGAVVAAAKAALTNGGGVAAPAEADPFETATEAVAESAKPVTLEDVKAACVAAGKRTGQDKVQKIVMEHGGKGKNAATGVEGPSLNALPAGSYAAVIAAVAALPTTK